MNYTNSFSCIDKLGSLKINIHNGYINPIHTNEITKNWNLAYDKGLDCYFTGIVDLTGKFYYLPMQIFYIQFEQVKQNSIDILLYDKFYNKNRHISIYNLSKFYRLSDVVFIVNHLNLLIDNGFEIDCINNDIDYVYIKNRLNANFIDIINNLKFEFFNVERSRVGKDDVFHDEIVITNLPTEDYLRSVLAKCVEYDGSCGTLTNDSIVLQYNYYSGFHPANNGRHISNFDNNMYRAIIDYIFFKFNINYTEANYFYHLICNV